MSQQTSAEPGHVDAENLDVAVPDADTTLLLEIPCDSINTLSVEVSVVDEALDGFEIRARLHRNSDWQVLYDAAGDFTSPIGLLIGTSGDLTAQAEDTTGWFIMDVTGLFAVQVRASGAADSATVTARGTGRGT